MTEKLKACAHYQILAIKDEIMNFYTTNLKQSSIVSCYTKPGSNSTQCITKFKVFYVCIIWK